MANRWGNNGNSDRLFSWAPKSPDGDCIHEIKRHLLLGRIAMNNLDSLFKSRDYFSNKGPSSETMAFFNSQVWIWELYHKEGRVPKNQYIWTVVWRRLLRVSWTARRSNQSVLKEISPEYLLEGLMLKLKLQYMGHLMRRSHSLGNTLILGKIEVERRGW